MMKQNAQSRVVRMTVCAAVLAAAFAGSAAAESRVPGEYARSKQPVYKVGTYNPKLSRLCRENLFTQRGDLRLSIGYLGKIGRGITGIAQVGYNLYDPTRAGDPKMTYHFFSQGYSNCRVYEAVTPPPPPQPAGR